MKSEVLILQHEAVEGPGRIADALSRAGLDFGVLRRDLGDHLPAPKDIQTYAGLVVLGGSAGVGEIPQAPNLAAEQELVFAALRADVPTLGICLGSQLMAAALGSKVRSGEWEIGWHPVRRESDLGAALSLPDSFPALHWHTDRFDTPPGTTLLASTPSTPCQAFAMGAHLGLLFHLEADPTQTEAMAESLAEDLAEANLSAAALAALTEAVSDQAAEVAAAVFGAWTEGPRRRAEA